MNLLLLDPQQLDPDGAAIVTGPRLAHITGVLGKTVGDTLRVGVENGRMGTGQVEALDAHELRLRVQLSKEPPAPSPIVLAVALPRPPMLKRVLHTAACMGVKDIHVFHAARVEKSYWQSPVLEAASVREQIRLGLEQGVDTVVPKVTMHSRFRPFAEDVLPRLGGNDRILVAAVGEHAPAPPQLLRRTVVVIGPEGGFVPFETQMLSQVGQLVSLGPRILRVDVAVTAMLATARS